MPKEGVLQVPRKSGEPYEVTTLYERPRGARALMVLGHGAGASMRHAFMERVAEDLAGIGVATLRYQFPYMEAGRKRPDHKTTLLATIRAAVDRGNKLARGLPVVAAGKSMGGRMTSLAASEEPLPAVRGIAFFGFPLHAAGKPGAERGEHLREIDLPLLFLQGTRDALADLDLLRPLVKKLAQPTLHVVEGADHGFKVRKKDGRTPDDVFAELSRAIDGWIRPLL